MDTEISFGEWLRRRRRMLDLTQEELAQQVGCAVVTIRKLETDERRPSKELAKRLADCLKIAPEEYAKFVAFARSEPYLTLASPPADPATPLPGQPPAAAPVKPAAIEKLGRYEILAKLGQGSFATVYRARDTELGRLVALKELSPHLLADVSWVERFQREARLIARLNHPRIVPILDVGQAAGRQFIVIRLVDGPTLRELLASRGRFSWPETVETISAVAEGLDHAHSQGILHRDLKPANILIDPKWGPQLSDFGLAKLESEHSMTQSGHIVGTPHYMAPEIWEGQTATPQADIYALGCILYELLSGEKLFAGETPPAVMMAHFKPLALPGQWPEGTPSGVVKVLRTALARKPDDRYATAGEMADELRASPLTTTAGLDKDIQAGRKSVSPTFCVTDLEGYGRLMDQHGEVMVSVLQRYYEIIETAVYRHNGRVLTKAGDGYFIVFEHNNPLPCVLEIHQQLVQQDWGEVGSLRVKIGLHHVRAEQEGREFFRRGNEYFGSALTHIARIENAARGGQILASASVVEGCRLPSNAMWEDMGLHQLKDVGGPQRLYCLKPVESEEV
jgi:class 3 adenylate cyclase/transcriptional regulator with XRE-family HTH domain